MLSSLDRNEREGGREEREEGEKRGKQREADGLTEGKRVKFLTFFQPVLSLDSRHELKRRYSLY